jgi:two-component system sensor histidine kinase KdpD
MSQRTPLLPAPQDRLRLTQLWVLDRRRTAAGLVLAVLLPVLVQLLLAPVVVPDREGAGSGIVIAILLQLLTAVLVALVGGLWPAVIAAVAASLALNWFATEPVGSFTVASPQAVLELGVFLVVACTVGLATGAAARRYEQASRAQAEAGAMGELALGILGSSGGIEEFLERVRRTLGLRAVTLLARRPASAGTHDAALAASAGQVRRSPPVTEGAPAEWDVVATAGESPPVSPAAAEDSVAPDGYYMLLAAGHPLDPAQRRTLAAFGVYLVAMRERTQLARSREANRRLEEGNSIRTAILQAVSHDLRTPLAGIKLSVSSLRQPAIAFSQEEEAELLATIEDYTDRLSHVVGNLLDMSRISADNVRPLLRAVDWRDVLPRGLPDQDRVVDRIPDDAPAVAADPVLLERVIANLVENALRYAPADPVELTAGAAEDGEGLRRGVLRVVDHGAGIPPEDLLAVFRPFQRLGDGAVQGGVGLGLAVAKGFTEAMGGRIEAERTPGGGLTMSVSLPLAASAPSSREAAAP